MSDLHGNSPSSSTKSNREQEPYNIIPIHYPNSDQPILQIHEVTLAIAALCAVENLPKPLDDAQLLPSMDLLDWLALFFRFQNDNVKNQREHLVLHLANSQMALTSLPDDSDSLDTSLVRSFRSKLLENYAGWCSFLNLETSIHISDRSKQECLQRELLYISLYLLIWGESANLRFMPESICYIFHNMAMELNKILDNYSITEQPKMSLYSGENAFLNYVVKPIYETIRAEVESSRNGKAPHSTWRNYDDLNEYFWTKRCFEKLKWPIDAKSNYFVSSNKQKHVGKTGFVEQRSFWNLFRSFDRLWVMLILFFQASIIIAWKEKTSPWQGMKDKNVQVQVLTIFLTWSLLEFLQSVLGVGMQCSLVSKETIWTGVKMLLQCTLSAGWTVVLFVFYGRIWSQKNRDGEWSNEANRKVDSFLKLTLAFLLPKLLGFAAYALPMRWKAANWRSFYLLDWWFQERSFSGLGLRVGLVDTIKYSIFWVAVLTTKFTFSYFLQVQPMIEPSKQLLDLRIVHYKWHECLSIRTRNLFAVGLLWLPIVLIYLVDLQMWYSIFSSYVGSIVGLLAHLGEIRNIEQFKFRFKFLARAVQFNLIPEQQQLRATGNLESKFKNELRYLNLESIQVETNKFALIWNEIIMTFREEDIISDRELELLEVTQNSWNVSVVRWPCFLLCNELLRALNMAKELVDAPDKFLRNKICKNDYRRCAVREAYDSVKHLLLEIIIKFNTVEHSIITVLFKDFDSSLQAGKFTDKFSMIVLPRLHRMLIKLVQMLSKPKKDINQVVNALQSLYEIAVRDFYKVKRCTAQLREDGLAPYSAANGELLFENAVELLDTNDETFHRQIRRLQTILTSRHKMHDIPKNIEARRRIAFFSNSLFMNMPRAPLVEKMMAFSVLTPYYDEQVLYNMKQLQTQNEDGISILYYLQTVYEDEWKNFIERMRREGLEDNDDIWTLNLRLWASYRGQTLARTVRGMMYNHRALKLLANLDSASDMDIGVHSSRQSGSIMRDGCSDSFQSACSDSFKFARFQSFRSSLSSPTLENGLALMKYTYVVACQMYGAQKAQQDPRAADILYLMQNNEALRVAYVDEVNTGNNEKEYCSVLVKYDQQLKKEVEIYRIKLPGPFKLGEGKPENQNHAIIFTRGEALQAIDMNQDNYFEETLKMRNLLEEYNRYGGIRKPTVLGIREHIFSGSVSSLAGFMSAQETSFVTLGQRVFANPLKVRMHYGHPDVFDRFWFLTRGGISKASKVINITEDIFAGFNCTLRGGNITHNEYIQVGKGRDLGLNQVSMFEAKIASGSGEQVLSRDVYRLGQGLDLFRMMSFFYTTVGFYFNAMMVILAVYVILWGRLYFAFSGVEASARENNIGDRKAARAILYQQFIIQMGLFALLPCIVENALEHGVVDTLWEFLMTQFQLSSFFYTFSLGTKIHYFGRTILHGGATYRATGRGFDVQHTSFAKNYRLYSRSHFVKAIEVALILAVYVSHSTIARNTYFYMDLTISSWLLVFSWIMVPFLFNPLGFDWLKTVHDFEDFMNWIWYKGGMIAKAEQSWERWWHEEQDHLRTTGYWGKLLEIVLNLRFLFFQYCIVYQLGIADGNTSIAVYLLSWIYIVVAFGIHWIISSARDKYEEKENNKYRLVLFLVIMFVVVVIVVLRKHTSFRFMDIFTSLLAFIPTGWGILSIAQVLRSFLQPTPVWDSVVSLARLYDLIFGVIVMAPVAFLSWMPGFQLMQARILFNEAFCRGLRIFQIISGLK